MADRPGMKAISVFLARCLISLKPPGCLRLLTFCWREPQTEPGQRWCIIEFGGRGNCRLQPGGCARASNLLNRCPKLLWCEATRSAIACVGETHHIIKRSCVT